VLSIAKRLKEMVGTRRLELLTSTVSSSRPLTQKDLITGGTGRTVILGAICYQIATKNTASVFGAESWGISPFTVTFLFRRLGSLPHVIAEPYHRRR
jgi:hypothetical protein